MKLNTSGGGRRTSKSRGTRAARGVTIEDPDVVDPDSPEYAATDWEGLPRHDIELDPALVEAIRSRGRLKQITLRIGVEQIAEARRVAAERGLKYQRVLRQWLAEGASRTRIRRQQAAHGQRRSR